MRERSSGKGMTIPEMDAELQRIGGKGGDKGLANFDGGRLRTADERVWGELYSKVRMVRDNAVVQATEKAAPELAQALRANRDWYHKNIDTLENFSDKVKTDPINSAKVLFHKTDVENVRQLKRILPDDVFDGLSHQFLDNLRGNLGSTEGKLGASGIAKDLKQYKPEVLAEILGESRATDLVKLVNVARRIEAAPKMDFTNPDEHKLVQQAWVLITKLKLSEAPGFAMRLFERNKGLQDHFSDKMLAQDPSGYTKAQARANASLKSQARWGNTAARVGGSIAGQAAGLGLVELMRHAVGAGQQAAPPTEGAPQ